MELEIYTEREILEYLGISKSKLSKIRRIHKIGKYKNGYNTYTKEDRDLLFKIAYAKRLSRLEEIKKSLKEHYPITEYMLWKAALNDTDFKQFKGLLADLTFMDSNIWEDDEGSIWYYEPM